MFVDGVLSTFLFVELETNIIVEIPQGTGADHVVTVVVNEQRVSHPFAYDGKNLLFYNLI